MSKKVILHLCADLGSDSRFYQLDDRYEVITVGEDWGVENLNYTGKVHGIIANPVCTEFSTANGFHKVGDLDEGMFLVNHCLRVIRECQPVWWVLENPANGRLKEFLGKPVATYQPWQFGSPWTKRTALWGDFVMPTPLFNSWQQVTENPKLYKRPNRPIPSLAFMHKAAIHHIPEFEFAIPFVKTDADFRSLCSQGFAKAFYESNP